MAFENLSERLQNTIAKLTGKGKVSEADVKEMMREVRLALLEADVNFKVVKDFVKKISERAVGTEVMKSLTPAQQIVKIVNEELVELLGGTNVELNQGGKITTTMMVGLQGAGKTTTAGKLALKVKKTMKKKPLLIAADVYRPAAVQQLKTLGKQLDSVMNYPWKDAIINFVKYNDAKKFSVEILKLVENYPQPALDCIMNLLDSHDTERVLTLLAFDNPESIPVNERPTYKLSDEQYTKARELLKFASFIQFTLPGVPCIYYGDEIGMYGFRDPYNRLGFAHDKKDSDLLNHYIELSNFRHDNKENFITGFEMSYIADKCIAYRRNDILCIINLDNKAHFIPEYNGEKISEVRL